MILHCVFSGRGPAREPVDHPDHGFRNKPRQGLAVQPGLPGGRLPTERSVCDLCFSGGPSVGSGPDFTPIAISRIAFSVWFRQPGKGHIVEFCKGARQSGLVSVWQHTLVGQGLQGFL